MHVRDSRLHIHIVVCEHLFGWPRNIASLWITSTSSSQKLDVAVGPQLPRVTTQHT